MLINLTILVVSGVSMGKIAMELDDRDAEKFAVVKTQDGRYVLGTKYDIPQVKPVKGLSDDKILAQYPDDVAVVITRPEGPEGEITVDAYRILADVDLKD